MEDDPRLIPLLPKKVAATIQLDLIDYCSELKFLLLFFERPLAVMSTIDYAHVPADASDRIRKGLPTLGDGAAEKFTNVGLLATDEWLEVLALCDKLYLEVEDSDAPSDTAPAVDDIISTYAKLPGSPFSPPGTTTQALGASFRELIDRNDEQPQKITVDSPVAKLAMEWVFRKEFERLFAVLQHCRKQNIPMVWASEEERQLASLYSNHLLSTVSANLRRERVKVDTRILRGAALLKNILDLDVVSLNCVPIHKIVTFRNNNADLLNNFLADYRAFLVEIQHKPKNLKTMTREHSNRIVHDLQQINGKIASLRATSRFGWLRKINAEQFDIGKSLSTMSTWSLIAMPLTLLLLSLQGWLGSTQDAEQIFLKSSAGYLWKAREKLAR